MKYPYVGAGASVFVGRGFVIARVLRDITAKGAWLARPQNGGQVACSLCALDFAVLAKSASYCPQITSFIQSGEARSKSKLESHLPLPQPRTPLVTYWA
ncbi:hypothetical protein VTK56DRAFT_5227 [Thermocarpiscus australiensis]